MIREASGRGDELQIVDRSGTILQRFGGIGFDSPSVSPDGRWIATAMVGSGEEGLDIWTFDLERGGRSQFTFSDGDERFPIWTPRRGVDRVHRPHR